MNPATVLPEGREIQRVQKRHGATHSRIERVQRCSFGGKLLEGCLVSGSELRPLHFLVEDEENQVRLEKRSPAEAGGNAKNGNQPKQPPSVPCQKVIARCVVLLVAHSGHRSGVLFLNLVHFDAP